MKTTLLVSAFFLATFVCAQQPQWDWAKGAGGPGNDASFSSYTTDDGYTFVTGYIADTAIFYPFVLAGTAAGEVFIAKYAPWGDCIWATRCPAYQGSSCVTVDQQGNSYILADGSPFQYLVKFDTTGTLVSSVQLYTMPFVMRILDLKFNPSFGFWMCGKMYGATHIFGSDTLSGTVSFIARYDMNGNAIDAKALGTNGGYQVSTLTWDNSGSIFVCGELMLSDTIDQVPCITTNINQFGPTDFCLIKLDAALTVQWIVLGEGLGAGSSDRAIADENGGCYIMGQVAGDYEVLQGDTIYGATPSCGCAAVFVSHFDAGGTMTWIERTTPGAAGFNDIALHNQKLWITGFTYSGWFDIGPYAITGLTGATGFVIEIDLSGNTQDLFMCPHAFCYSVNTDTAGSVYVSGYSKSPAFFEPYVVPFNGAEEIFLAKLRTGPVGILDGESNSKVVMSRMQDPDVWQLQVHGEIRDQLALELYDVTGRAVKQVSVNSAYTEISCSDLASGVYTWSLSAPQQNVANGKIIR